MPIIFGASGSGGLSSPVAFSDVETVAQSRILGRASGAGTGTITELTSAEVKTILSLTYSTDYRVMAVRVTADSEDLVVGDGVATFHVFAPTGNGWLLQEVLAGVSTAPTGSGITVQIQDDSVDIFSTALTIDASETTTATATATAALTSTPLTIARASKMTVDVNAIGSSTPGKGLVLYFVYREA